MRFLSTRFFSSIPWQPRLTLSALCLMLTVPFLMAHHYHPIPAFYQEWAAAFFGLVALSLLLRREFAERLELPELTLLPLGLLLIVVAQWLLLPNAPPARLQLFSLYLIWAALMLILGRQLARSLGLEKISQWLATAILVGALLEALTAGLQLEGSIGLPWIFPHTTGIGLRGNLAQHNNFSNYLWLGIAAALYLRSQQWLKRPTAAIAIAILIIFTVLSGSRSTWLYASGLVLLSSWAAWRWPEQTEMRRARRWSLAALIGAIAFQLLVSSGLLAELASLFASLSGSSAGSRLLAGGSSDPMRLALWRAAWLTWQEHPWLGAGIGQYTWQFHQHVLELMPMRLPGLPEHAHNLLFQLLAETGLAGALLLVIFGGRWIFQLIRQEWTSAHGFFAASLLILLLHSGLEYPLWYAFFLGPAALMAGALSAHNRPLRLQRSAPPVIAGVILLGVLSLYNLRADYKTLEDTVNGRFPAYNAADFQQHYRATANALSRSEFMDYLVLMATANQADNGDDLAAKLSNCQRALRFSATRMIVFKCAHLQALAGQHEAAKLALKRAVASYPDEAEALLPQWQKRAAQEPAIAFLLSDFPPTVPAAAQR